MDCACRISLSPRRRSSKRCANKYRMSNKGCCLLFIVSAPSGTGKTTVVERLVRVTERLKLSRSYTSRAPRGDEANGVDYNFVSRDQFETMIANGEFLEHAEV